MKLKKMNMPYLPGGSTAMGDHIGVIGTNGVST